MNNNCPFKYALFTTNHVLNKSSIEIGKNIYFEYFKEEKKIEITKDRKVYTNEELDYTCIEIFKSDGINHYFNIEPEKFENNKDIFILQYPNGKDLSFLSGKITSFKRNKIIHNALAEHVSSGAPIIRRTKDNYIIGLYFDEKIDNNYIYNYATPIDLIINDINGIKEPNN